MVRRLPAITSATRFTVNWTFPPPFTVGMSISCMLDEETLTDRPTWRGPWRL